MGNPRNDLTGQVFNYYTVISFHGRDRRGRAKWLCMCECGVERIVDGHKLTSGHSKSCGCYQKKMMSERNFIELTGQKFGKLTVIEFDCVNKFRHNTWRCTCECGSTVSVDTAHLRSGNTASCGCMVGTTATHGYSRRNNVRSEYHSWSNMKARCYNPRNTGYEYYGAKGVTVCDRWIDSFENFIADMGPMPADKDSIDRINSFGDYEPNNCRWSDAFEQNNNKRSHQHSG